MDDFYKRRGRLLSKGIFEPTELERLFNERMMEHHQVQIYGLHWYVRTRPLYSGAGPRAEMIVLLDASRSPKWRFLGNLPLAAGSGVLLTHPPAGERLQELGQCLLEEYRALPDADKEPFDTMIIHAMDFQASARSTAYGSSLNEVCSYLRETFSLEPLTTNIGVSGDAFFALVRDRVGFDRLVESKPAVDQVLYTILKTHDPFDLIRREDFDFSVYWHDALRSEIADNFFQMSL